MAKVSTIRAASGRTNWPPVTVCADRAERINYDK